MSLSGSLGGAYDLSALKKKAEAQADARDASAAAQGAGADAGSAAGSGAGAGDAAGGVGGPAGTNMPAGADLPGGSSVPGPFELTVTSENLETVLQTSMHLPVVLVFHSEKSENSTKLAATMSALAARFAGRFQLGLVDVEASREVTGAFGISAVPAAAALLQAQPVPLFQGLPDDEQLIDTVEKLLEAAQQYGLNGVLDGDADGTPPEPEIPPLHKEGLEALEKGDLEGAHAAYTKALKESPADSEARTALHQVELLQRVRAANPEGSPQVAESILLKAKDAPMTDVEPHLEAADVEFSYGRPDAAFARLIDVVRNTTDDDRNLARTRLLALFDIAGPHSELVGQARKALTNALF